MTETEQLCFRAAKWAALRTQSWEWALSFDDRMGAGLLGAWRGVLSYQAHRAGGRSMIAWLSWKAINYVRDAIRTETGTSHGRRRPHKVALTVQIGGKVRERPELGRDDSDHAEADSLLRFIQRRATPRDFDLLTMGGQQETIADKWRLSHSSILSHRTGARARLLQTYRRECHDEASRLDGVHYRPRSPAARMAS